MATSKTIFTFLFLIFSVKFLSGQVYQPPKPKMTKNLVNDFIRAQMQYPEQARKNNEEGTVLIDFKVDKAGNIISRNVTRSVSPVIDSAAVRLFSLILWEPAKYSGEPVEGESEFKLKYNIKRYESLVKKRGYDQFLLPYEPVSSSFRIFTVKELDKAPEAIIDPAYHSIKDFILQNLTLPEAAQKLHLAGEVRLQFIIETNGLPSNIMIIQPLGGGCTEEAIRITQMIGWNPGIKDGEAVRTCYNLSFIFKPPDEIKSKEIPNQSNPGI